MSRPVPVLLLILVASAFAAAQQSPAQRPDEALATTLFVPCEEGQKAQRVLSPISASDGERWRAYVDVHVDADCLHTTRLWVAQVNEKFRLVYLMPPKRDASGNGMQILGWAKNSRLLLMRTEEWQLGTDGGTNQRVFAIDAKTGMVHEPELTAMLENSGRKGCGFSITEAGFGGGPNIEVLVRARFFSPDAEGETGDERSTTNACSPEMETWIFNFATGEVRQVSNTEPMRLTNRVAKTAAAP